MAEPEEVAELVHEDAARVDRPRAGVEGEAVVDRVDPDVCIVHASLAVGVEDGLGEHPGDQLGRPGALPTPLP